MTRIAIRHTFSALAAIALVSAFATSPASAQSDTSHKQEMEYLKHEKWGVSQEQTTPTGLATQKQVAKRQVVKIPMGYNPVSGGSAD